MPPLPRELRKILEDAVVKARADAEKAASAALVTIGVQEKRPHASLSESDRALRLALAAKLGQLGSIDALVAEIAYQHWHRMLFARFLIENKLMVHPDFGVAVSMEEISDLAREQGESDPWVLAARYAAQMLPAIFRTDDPELALRLAPEGRQALEARLSDLPREVFVADDALGWVYQFWQSERKKQVNASETKIGAAELPAVTQLFTEDYMVRFLLENSLGAWWAARHPQSPLLADFTYLRLAEDGKPAVGSFEGWPETVAEVTVMDPCCGSGHFLTAAFEMLAAMRMEEEGLDARVAGDAVIASNLFGLELDPRCTQIAAFALAHSAWKLGGYRQLPAPNIACSGIGVKGQLEEWKKLAEGNGKLERALTALHEQFRNAPELGSLIDPRRATDQGNLFSVDYEEVAPLLEKLLDQEHAPETQEAGWAAAGIARAASLLARTYTLVATNVPFLGRRHQGAALIDFADNQMPLARHDLATMMIERLLRFLEPSSLVALVSPQGWTTLGGVQRFRRNLMEETRIRAYARLGPGAFREISGEIVKVGLLLAGRESMDARWRFAGLDCSECDGVDEKAVALEQQAIVPVSQTALLAVPDARLTISSSDRPVALLSAVAEVFKGLTTGDDPRFRRCFWEVASDKKGSYELLQSGSGSEDLVDGCHGLLLSAKLDSDPPPGFRPMSSVPFGRPGVAVGHVGSIHTAIYFGGKYDQSVAVLIPADVAKLPAVLCYCRSPEFEAELRLIDSSVKVTDGSLVKVPFDLEHWTRVAEEQFPDGLPEPDATNPTQWLFKGNLTSSADPLQVAVARLLGYSWPDQEPDALDTLADPDGIVCLPSVVGERPAAERLRVLLETAYGTDWSQGRLSGLLTEAGAPNLETWLRDGFFAGHCKMFHNRPFIWQIWDGRKDGFAALVDYHRLDAKLLSRLTHTLLGDWITQQRAQVKADAIGAEARLAAAQDLQGRLGLILEGESPYDTFVRWRPLSQQAIGWEPDLNDGVRLNIRPFVEAKVLRSKFTMHWKKDRGRNPDGSERHNDLHLTRAEKETARQAGGQG